MLLAEIGSFGYNLVLLLHILAFIVAFAPAFVWPLLNRQRRLEGSQGDQDASKLSGIPIPASAPTGGAISAIIDPIVHGGALVLAGIFGIGLIGMSSKAFEFSQTWVSIAFVLWFLMIGVFFAGLVPAQRAIREGKVAAEQRLAMSYGGMHLLLLLQIIVMVWSRAWRTGGSVGGSAEAAGSLRDAPDRAPAVPGPLERPESRLARPRGRRSTAPR